MKIGILTLNNALNQGAILQEYALYKFMRKIGADIEVIDYHNEKIKKMYEIYHPYTESLKSKISALCRVPSNYVKKKNFDDFISKNINVSQKIYNTYNIEELSINYDMIIVGSDQVWNLNCTGNDFTFFLPDIAIRKVSYAASFGDYPINKNTINYIKDFEKVGVREKNAVKRLNEIGSKNIHQNLDPTFLIEKKEWEKERKVINEKYILMYLLYESKELILQAKELARKLKCKIYCFGNYGDKEYCDRIIKCKGPDSFLDYIYSAEIILTNSFHGTVFSIIFEKNFYVDSFSIMGEQNERISNLLSVSGLENRDITNSKDTIVEINYQNLSNELEEAIELSKKYLKQLLD